MYSQGEEGSGTIRSRPSSNSLCTHNTRFPNKKEGKQERERNYNKKKVSFSSLLCLIYSHGKGRRGENGVGGSKTRE